MKQFIVYSLIALFAIIGLSGCINDEGGEDLDVITPADSAQSRIEVRQL